MSSAAILQPLFNENVTYRYLHFCSGEKIWSIPGNIGLKGNAYILISLR